MYKPEYSRNSYLSAKNNRSEISYPIKFIFFLLTIILSSPNLYAQENLIKQIEVKNGAVIIDGKYIEPPYLIEARDNGIWINGVQAEKITKRKEQYKKIKEDRMRNEIYAEYFELGEEIGREQAREKVVNNLMARKSIKGVNFRKAKMKTSDEIEIESETGDDFAIELSTNLSSNTEGFMLELVVSKKYTRWFKASVEEEKDTYDDLINFLEKQKEKGRIEAYKFEKGYEFEKDSLRIKYKGALVWHRLWSASTVAPEKASFPSDEESVLLDKKDSQRKIEVIANALNGGYLEVYSQGYHKCAAPGGKSIIFELKTIMADRNINLDQRKEKIKKVYLPANAEDKFLQEILDNFQ